jgi:hypothetical protein
MLFARAPLASARRPGPARPADLVLRLDAWLRRRQGIFEFSADPGCILRAQVTRLEGAVVLADGTAGRPGDRVLHIHLWNEHVPPIPAGGPSLSWGRQFSRAFAGSLGELARFLARCPELADVAIVRADMSIGSTAQDRALYRIVSRHGFEIIPDPGPPSRARQARWFGENILFWLLTVACNPAAARADKFWRSRTPIYLPRRALEQRHDPRLTRAAPPQTRAARRPGLANASSSRDTCAPTGFSGVGADPTTTSMARSSW